MSIVPFKLRNSVTDKEYSISAPIGERVDTATGTTNRYIDLDGVRYRNEGTEEDPVWTVFMEI